MNFIKLNKHKIAKFSNMRDIQKFFKKSIDNWKIQCILYRNKENGGIEYGEKP